MPVQVGSAGPSFVANGVASSATCAVFGRTSRAEPLCLSDLPALRLVFIRHVREETGSRPGRRLFAVYAVGYVESSPIRLLRAAVRIVECLCDSLGDVGSPRRSPPEECSQPDGDLSSIRPVLRGVIGYERRRTALTMGAGTRGVRLCALHLSSPRRPERGLTPSMRATLSVSGDRAAGCS